jgi:hypothetical protein
VAMADAMRTLRSWSWKFLLIVLVLAVLYTWLTLNWSYSRGERAGYVQKLSRKGWICKTWKANSLWSTCRAR